MPPKNRYVELVYDFADKRAGKKIACPVMVKPFNVPSQTTIDKDKTDELFRLLKAKLVIKNQ